jgi:hypothetical protein
MKSGNAGLLLLLVAALGLIGFLTGNLDRWLGYLFDPTRPPLGSSSSSSSSTSSGSGVTVAIARTQPLSSVGSTTQRVTA